MNKVFGVLIFLIFFGLVFFIEWLIYSIAYNNGHTRGYSEGIDASNRIDCEFEFRGEPLSNVNTECLKYFKKDE